jgi:hypothetical protein
VYVKHRGKYSCAEQDDYCIRSYSGPRGFQPGTISMVADQDFGNGPETDTAEQHE